MRAYRQPWARGRSSLAVDESVIDPGLKVVGSMKLQTNADENAAVETNPLSNLL
jgi:hypothetical protein